MIADLNAMEPQTGIRKIKNTTKDYQVVGGTRFRNISQATDSIQ